MFLYDILMIPIRSPLGFPMMPIGFPFDFLVIPTHFLTSLLFSAPSSLRQSLTRCPPHFPSFQLTLQLSFIYPSSVLHSRPFFRQLHIYCVSRLLSAPPIAQSYPFSALFFFISSFIAPPTCSAPASHPDHTYMLGIDCIELGPLPLKKNRRCAAHITRCAPLRSAAQGEKTRL